MLTTTVYDDIIGKPTAQQAAPQQATETTAQAAAPQAGVATQVADTQVTNTAAAPAETATQQTTQATQTVAQPTQQNTRPMSYADMFVAMNPYKPMTPEERAAEAKRNRRNAMFAAISDGISALSNLYFTTKGAPNSFNGGSTLSGKMYERQRQLEKEREAMDKDYINGYLRAMEMDRNRDLSERNYQQQLKQFEYNMQRNAAADKRADEERDEKRRINSQNERYAKARADRAEVDAQTYPSYRQSVIDKNNRSNPIKPSKEGKQIRLRVGDQIVKLPQDEVGDFKTYINGLANRAGILRSKFKNDTDFQNAVQNSPEAQELIMSDANRYGSMVSDRNESNNSTSQGNKKGWSLGNKK